MKPSPASYVHVGRGVIKRKGGGRRRRRDSGQSSSFAAPVQGKQPASSLLPQVATPTRGRKIRRAGHRSRRKREHHGSPESHVANSHSEPALRSNRQDHNKVSTSPDVTKTRSRFVDKGDSSDVSFLKEETG